MIIYFLLAFLLITAILSVEMKNLYKSVLCLGLCGVVLGIIFFILQASLVGIFQIGIYGGMTLVLVFLITMVGENHE
jgi:NADH:ubiquinone oxidoreductase subunit 6 (subunit J)